MTTTAIKHFDILEYVKKAKENGIKEEFAEYTARQFEQLAEAQAEAIQEQNTKIAALETKELATKGDIRESELRLQKEIAQSSNKIIIWVIGFIVASGLIQHFFK
jgi:hypothetical protein